MKTESKMQGLALCSNAINSWRVMFSATWTWVGEHWLSLSWKTKLCPAQVAGNTDFLDDQRFKRRTLAQFV
jgi:hypothetical protein